MRRTRREGPVVGLVGVGYMGIATGLGFAARGRTVVAYDIRSRTRSALRRGRSPYAEDGLPELLRRMVSRHRFQVVDSLEELAQRAECIFLCVPTPPKRSGEVDLGPLRTAARALGAALRGVRGYRLVVVKSTVVPGTTDRLVEPLVRTTSGKDARSLGVAVNPEFLSEGRMVDDALHPARIVVGAREPRARRLLRAVYTGFPARIFELPPAGAELVKHASNEFLALKVSYANELSRWSERLGSDVDAVVAAVGADPRIGTAFLRAGPGFGGSCFDKDLRAFARRGAALGVDPRIPATVLAVNEDQTEHALELVRSTAGSLARKEVAVLGLAFKVGTDDVRESRAFPIVEGLIAGGARVRVHDPSALANFRTEWIRSGRRTRRIAFARSTRAALNGADLAVLQADWPEYRDWSDDWTRAMRRPVVVDLRRCLDVARADRSGLHVVALGRSSAPAVAGRSRPRGGRGR